MFSDSFEIQIFLQTLAMIHAIEMINNSTLLSGVTLGYEIYDTCAEVTKAMASALRFLSKSNTSKDIVEFKCNYSDYVPRIKAVTGASYSEVSMAVSRLLALQLIPQVGLRELFHLRQRIKFTMARCGSDWKDCKSQLFQKNSFGPAALQAAIEEKEYDYSFLEHPSLFPATPVLFLVLTVPCLHLGWCFHCYFHCYKKKKLWSKPKSSCAAH